MKLSAIITILPLSILASAAPQVTDPLPPTSTCSPSTAATSPSAPLRCGGFMANPPTCPAGQTCIHPLSVNPDLPGFCIGQRCGGFVAHPQECPQGQICVHERPIADIPGYCLMTNVKCTSDGTETCPGADGEFKCVADPTAECMYGVDEGCEGLCAPA